MGAIHTGAESRRSGIVNRPRGSRQKRMAAGDNDAVAIYVELRDGTGLAVTGLPDPSGGTFDAAGDFDRFLDAPPYGQVPNGLPILESLDPFGTTATPSGVMARLISDCVRALAVAKDGPERKGLIRLRVLAEECSRRPESTLHWIGN